MSDEAEPKKGIIRRTIALPFYPITRAGKSFKGTMTAFSGMVSKTKNRTKEQTTDHNIQRTLFLEGMGVESMDDITEGEKARIEKLSKKMRVAGYVFLSIGSLFIVFASYSLFQGNQLGFFSGVLFAAINGISSNKNFFRAWQIEQSRLGTMREFWESIGEDKR